MSAGQVLRVTAVRSQNPFGYGGCIFSAKAINEQGQVLDAKRYLVVKASGLALGGSKVEPGQWWMVYGESSTRVLETNGYRLLETQIEAFNAVLLRPSGEYIVAFMGDSPLFKGIGRVKARQLWESLGEELYSHLDSGNVSALSTVLNAERAAQVIEAWSQHGDSRTLQWLQAQGLELSVGRKVIQFFGSETAQKLEEDPYRLLSFCSTWKQADTLARSHFDVALDDPRRLQAAVEESCYRVFAAGHTSMSSSKLMQVLQGVLGSQTSTFPWRSLVPVALSQGLNNGSFIAIQGGVQPLGAMVMEAQVAQAVADRVKSDRPRLLLEGEVEESLRVYETREGLELNPQQREAVHLVAAKPFALITGGAGVGKTTVLKAVYEIYDRAGVGVIQLALAGRAAKRMAEATGRPASTIANFLSNWKSGSFHEHSAVVVDEASMVDIITMSRLCQLLGRAPRLVLVGDPAQLMPVGPGLVLHALMKVDRIPLVQLTVVKRYGSDIAAAATAIRDGQWPKLASNSEAAIGFIPCVTGSTATDGQRIADIVLKLYRMDQEGTQVLCARRNGEDGATTLNNRCQAELTAGRKAVQVWDSNHEAFALAGLNLGDPVLCTRNLWDRGLQNGSLGVIAQVESEPRLLVGEHGVESGYALAWVDWDDGVRRPVVEDMLDDLELGFAITVHKAQGSQWPRVIVPLTGHQLLDRTLVYTAVTRAQKQVLLVGDETAAKAAVEGAPRAQARQVRLDLLLAEALA